MSHIDDTLLKNERIIYRARIHWSVFMLPMGAILLSVVWFPALPWLGLGFLIAGLLGLFSASATYRTSEYALTNQRVLANINTLSRLSADIPLRSIEQISVRHGLLGNILNFGTVVIRDTDDRIQTIPRVSTPQEFRRRIGDQLTSV